MKANNENGFTFIEIVVVMAILSILVTLAVPRMDFLFEKNKLQSSTSAITSSLYLARMKSVNDGLSYGVQFTEEGLFYVVKDPYGIAETFGETESLEDGIEILENTFIDELAVFNEYGQLEKTCLPTGDLTGTIILTDAITDSTRIEVTFITGRIRETNL